MERIGPYLWGLASHWRVAVQPRFPRVAWSLSLKLLAVIVAITLIGTLASSFLLLSLLRQQFIDQAETSTTHLNTPLRASLEHAMLTHDTAMLNTIVQQVSSHLGGESIRILDVRGVVQSSSAPAEVGTRLDVTAPACQSCHEGESGSALGAPQTALHSGLDGTPVLLSVSPIANEPQCNRCHPAEIKTLGVIMIEAPLTELDRQLQAGFWRVLLGGGVAFVLLVGLMTPALRRVVTGPVSELSKGVTAVGEKNLEYRPRVNSNDELGQLARAFDAMRAQLKASRAEMEERNQELSVLYEVALAAGQWQERQQMLDLALETVVERLGLEVGIIYLWQPASGRFERASCRGLKDEQLRLIERKRRSPGGDLTGDVARSGEVHFVADITKDSHFAGTFVNPHGRSYVNVPLKSKGRVVGTLELVSRAEHALTPRQVEILAAAGQQIGIAIDNTSLLADTRRAADEALALYRLGTEITASLEVEKVVAAVAHGAQEVLASDLALVAVLEADHKEFVVQAVAGHLLAEWRGLRVPVDQIAPFDLNAPVGLAELPADLPPALATFLKAEQITSLLIAPLMRGDRPYGAVVALARSRRVFSSDEVRLLTRLAQQVVVAIENAQLYQQVRHLAVLEERDRLAREMHDNLAQALGYLNLKASLTTSCLSNGEVAQAQAGLQEMKQITRAAYTDTREAIFNLRHAVWLGAGLLPMLRDYLAEYRAHYGLDVRLIVEQEAAAEFSTEVAAQLSRIVQEALTNIRKHAQAAHASVRFERESGLARIVIQDDGRGFELAAAGAGGQEHFGLQIMRERAASVGGTVEFEPQIGKGTRVVIRVPLQADQGGEG